MKKKVVKIDDDNLFNSRMLLVEGYIATAENNFQQLKEFLETNPVNEYESKFHQYMIFYRPLWFAALYNLGHSIELGIKWLLIYSSGEFILSHNIRVLKKELNNKIGLLCEEKLLQLLNFIIDDIDKSYFLDQKGEYINYNNDLFRYLMDTDGKKYKVLFQKFNNPNILEINRLLQHCHNLKRLFSIIEAQIQQFQNLDKFNMSYKQMSKKMAEVREGKPEPLRFDYL